MADPALNPPRTIGDVIADEQAAAAAQASAATAAATADAFLAATNVALAAANQTLALDLVAVGAPVFTLDAAGVVTVFVTDTSPAGFHSFVPLPASTPLPVPPSGS